MNVNIIFFFNINYKISNQFISSKVILEILFFRKKIKQLIKKKL